MDAPTQSRLNWILLRAVTSTQSTVMPIRDIENEMVGI